MKSVQKTCALIDELNFSDALVQTKKKEELWQIDTCTSLDHSTCMSHTNADFNLMRISFLFQIEIK